jgi:hypothetical protein
MDGMAGADLAQVWSICFSFPQCVIVTLCPGVVNVWPASHFKTQNPLWNAAITVIIRHAFDVGSGADYHGCYCGYHRSLVFPCSSFYEYGSGIFSSSISCSIGGNSDASAAFGCCVCESWATGGRGVFVL